MLGYGGFIVVQGLQSEDDRDTRESFESIAYPLLPNFCFNMGLLKLSIFSRVDEDKIKVRKYVKEDRIF